MPTATQHRNRPSRPYPRKLGRFINLGGGLYGSLDVVARDPHHLELQTGEDFIWFDREQAKNLRDTIDRFLAFHVHSRAAEEVEHLEERIEHEEREDELNELPAGEEVQEEAAPARRRRRKTP